MDWSVCAALRASWQAVFSGKPVRQAFQRRVCMISCNRFALASYPGHHGKRVEFPTASRARVRGLRHARAAVENSRTAVHHLAQLYFCSIKRGHLLAQTFFWYLYTWLILLVLTVALDTTILTSQGSQPPLLPATLRRLRLKVVPWEPGPF
jgi:hypothetical protein